MIGVSSWDIWLFGQFAVQVGGNKRYAARGASNYPYRRTYRAGLTNLIVIKPSLFM